MDDQSTLLLDSARYTLLCSQDPRISRLQRELRLPYSVAAGLLSQLSQEGMITGLLESNEPTIHPDHQRRTRRVVPRESRLGYVRRLVATAYFFLEMAEEKSNGDSRLFKAIKPHAAIGLSDARDLFLNRLYHYGLGLTEAALAFNEWLIERSLVPDYCDHIESAIRTECQAYARPFEMVQSDETRLRRSYLRLARFYLLMYCEGGSFHSRAPEWTVAGETPQSNQSAERPCGEHVVPCATIGRIAMDLYAEEASIHDVAQVIRRLLVIIYITPEQKVALDNGPANWRDVMPKDWVLGKGCIYARLHGKAIDFDPLLSHPCTCSSR